MEARSNNSICRICFIEGDDLQSVIGTKFRDIPLSTILRCCLPPQLNSEISYPPNICKVCSSELISSYLFIEKCKKAYEILDGKLKLKNGSNDCPICRKKFTELKSLILHQWKEHMNIVVTCEICGKEFNDHQQLSTHVGLHKDSISCEECGLKFKFRYLLAKHKIYSHQGKLKEDRHETDLPVGLVGKIDDSRKDRKRKNVRTRRIWNGEEIRIVCQAFKQLIEKNQLPSLKMCAETIRLNKELQRRTPAQVKAFIHNQFRREKRSLNHQMFQFSIVEKELVLKEFASYLDERISPSLSLCKQVIEKHEDLQARTARNIKTFVNREIARRRRSLGGPKRRRSIQSPEPSFNYEEYSPQSSVECSPGSQFGSPLRGSASPLRSSLRSSLGSPLRSSMGSPLRSSLGSPLRSSIESPLGTPLQSPPENNSVQMESPSIQKPYRNALEGSFNCPVQSPNLLNFEDSDSPQTHLSSQETIAKGEFNSRGKNTLEDS